MNKEEFGKYLRSLRKEKGLTLIELAKLTGVSNPYISQIENGKFLPSPDILAKLAKGLKVSSISLLLKSGQLGESAMDDVKSKGLKNYYDDLIADLSKTAESINDSSDDRLKELKKDIEPLLEDIKKMKEEISFLGSDTSENSRAIQERYLIGEIDEDERIKLLEEEYGIPDKKERLQELESEIEQMKIFQSKENEDLDILRFITQEGVSFLGKEISQDDKLKIVRTISALLVDHAPSGNDLVVYNSQKEKRIIIEF